MSNINFNNNINELKSIDHKNLRCTLLVPKNYIKILDVIRNKDNKSIESLITKFSYLIEKNIIFITPNLEKHTTLYQSHSKPKLNLIRSHFRCNPMVWHHWKRLSNHFGVSMCFLFIICLKKVNLKALDSVGTPTESTRIHNYKFLEITNFLRNYSHRWFYSRLYEKKIKKK